MRSLLLTLLIVGVGAGATSAQVKLGETQVVLVPASAHQPSQTGHVREFLHIKLSGDIRATAVSKLAALIPEARKQSQQFNYSGLPVVRLFVDSPGGEVLAAIQLGRLVRAQAVEVWVDAGAQCSSACVFVLAGGVSRLAVPGPRAARLGIHRPYFQPDAFAGLTYEQAQQRYSVLTSGVREYLAEMGIAPALFEAMMRVPSQQMRFITRDFAESTQLLGDDPAFQEWERANERKALGPERQAMLDRYIECVNAGRADRECGRLLRGWNEQK